MILLRAFSIQILGSTYADLQVAINEYMIAILYADASLPQNRLFFRHKAKDLIKFFIILSKLFLNLAKNDIRPITLYGQITSSAATTKLF